MAKGPKTAEPKAEPDLIPPPLAAAQIEEDSVLHAHLERQANHELLITASVARKARDDKERAAELDQMGMIQQQWAEHVAQQQKEQATREERDAAATNAARLREEISELKAAIAEKSSEADRLEKLLEG